MYKSLEASEDQYKDVWYGWNEVVRLEMWGPLRICGGKLSLHLLYFESPRFLPGRHPLFLVHSRDIVCIYKYVPEYSCLLSYTDLWMARYI